MLVCYFGECNEVVVDVCDKGVNFKYLSCGGDVKGDYDKWNSYSFSLSEVLCMEDILSVTGIFLVTFIDQGSANICFKVVVKMFDNINNCGSGLYFDNVQFLFFCNSWSGVC